MGCNKASSERSCNGYCRLKEDRKEDRNEVWFDDECRTYIDQKNIID